MVIRSVAVLGAGTMGAQIAAHFANAGVPALLLDVTADAARDGLKRARSLKPDPFFTPDTWKLVSTGGFDELARIKESDWIIEAIVEQLDIKRSLLEKVDAARRAGSIVSSNTSGIPIAALAEGRSADFRRHWLGTHFFNPPRYLHLLELIPTADTSNDVVHAVASFADHHLGKGVGSAKDSPNFIGNHVALYGVVQILKQVESGAFTIEEVDAITGPALGRPKSATFRTLDLAGIDILAHVVHNLYERLPDTARREFVLPPFVEKMVERKMIGEKTGQGFYKQVKSAGGDSEILTLDPATLEYRPRRSPKLPALESAAAITDVRERVRTLYNGKDRVGEFLRQTLMPTLEYTATITPAVAHSPDDVDRVMRWGFGWELGPFELMDAIKGQVREVPPAAPDLQLLKSSKDRNRVVKKNAGASLVDLGDGVLCVEFHSKMNAIGGDTIQMLHAGLKEASANFAALVVGNEGEHFSAGANIMLLLLEAQEENWDEVDLMVRAFQNATMALRYAAVPVIVAPAGLALGGGCEGVLHGDRVQCPADDDNGPRAPAVRLIPAGGGTKEMVARAAEQMPPGSTDFLPPIQRAFEAIGFAKVSASAPDAQRLGYLRPTDAVTMNRERLIADAKAKALQRVAEGYQPPAPRTAIPVGGDAVLAPLKLGIHLAWRAGRISDYDALIGRKLATIMAGGAPPQPPPVTEQPIPHLLRHAVRSPVSGTQTPGPASHT